MNYTNKIMAGSPFPTITLSDLSGQPHTLGNPRDGATWQMVLIYRGRHCPKCTQYLNQNLTRLGSKAASVNEAVFTSDTLLFG